MLRPSENGAVGIGWADYDEFLSENLVGYRGVVGFDCLRFVCFAICFRDESMRIVHRAAFVRIGGRGGGFAGGIFPSVFQGGADIFRFAYQRACGVRDRDGGLSVVVAEPAAGYGTFLRCSVDVPPEGLAVV